MNAGRFLRRVVAAAWMLGLALPTRAGTTDGSAGFVAHVNDTVNPYEVLGIYVIPGRTVRLEIPAATKGQRFIVFASEGPVESNRSGQWTWRAPRSGGLFPVVVRRSGDGATMTLNVFVQTPATAILEGSLNGYLIGSYPTPALGDQPMYCPPRGFIEVTAANIDARVSPHFTLGQFLCKQNGDHPKYVVLQERLLLFLEIVLREVNEHGWHCETLHVMSGYRTPSYNAAIGNVPYSRHLWGGAADVFIDADPVDGQMDDLNADGVIDKSDANALYDFIEEMMSREGLDEFAGGLGSYGTTSNHGPFVHVDVRGRRARWGRESD